jgi:hypothetical protein
VSKLTFTDFKINLIVIIINTILNNSQIDIHMNEMIAKMADHWMDAYHLHIFCAF